MRRVPEGAVKLDIVCTHYDDRARRVALAVQEATGIEHVLLFGSRARGDYGANSDIDLLVVHPEDSTVAATCQQVAQQAVKSHYDDLVSTDVVLISPALFASVQFGLNHIAAKAVRDGVMPMGHSYCPPPGSRPPQEPHRLESMERALHARRKFSALQRFMREGELEFYVSQVEYEVDFGEAAQGALEHALKALVASHRKEYARIHDLVKLEVHAKQEVPEFLGLKSPLEILSACAGGEMYGTPDFEQDIEEIFALVQADVEYLFSLIQELGGFDPGTVQKSDYKF